MRALVRGFALVAVAVLLGDNLLAQEPRAQYPAALLNSYFGLQIGYINYPFSNAQLEPGFSTASVQVPHLEVRAFLLGHEINKYLSVQATYMRPVQWVEYQNVNGDRSSHSVWMNVGGVTAKAQIPVTRSLSLYGEGGLGIVTRKGFDIGPSVVLKDANYPTLLFGSGLQYHVNPKWDLTTGVTALPDNADEKQPNILSFNAGFQYTMRRLPDDEVERNAKSGAIFPRRLIQIGYASNALGYSVNDFVSKGALPVFWAANVEVARGASVNYQSNVFHTRRLFSFDWGAQVSEWKSRQNGQNVTTASLYPLFRFTVVRARDADVYFDYSLAGPSFISKTVVDNNQLGRQFTFQDFMAVGTFVGRRHNINLELKISHYSNGNIFPRNAGVTVPLTLDFGYAF